VRRHGFGPAGPEVPVLGLGCNNFGWRIPAAESVRVVDAALEAGVTLFDTADVYGETASESFLGDALWGRRDGVFLVTKFGMPVPEAPDLPRGSAEYVAWAVDRSLERLRTDRIDLYMYHAPDGVTPLAETLGALGGLAESGKIRYAGISNVDAAQAREAAAGAEAAGVPLVAIENRFSLVRQRQSDELLSACGELGFGFLPYYPLESGLLTGKYRRGEAAPAGSRLEPGSAIWPSDRWLTDKMFDRVERVERFASERDLSVLQVALGGLASLPGVTSVIAGATTPEQVAGNAAAIAWEPSAADLAELTEFG
jgi:aryl-alcohol dehydrogenase-like predicted oxidoreductase